MTIIIIHGMGPTLSENFVHYLSSLLCLQPLTLNWFLASAYEQGQTSPILKNKLNK